MRREFVDTVETYDSDPHNESVVFTHQPGCYFLKPRPPDVREVVRRALHDGRPLRVTVDDRTAEIDDAVVA